MATLYMDLDAGNDGDAGGVGDPWLTTNKYTTTEVRSPGDFGIVRRGTSEIISADVLFDEDGTLASWITLKGDNGDAWTADKTTLGAGSNGSINKGEKALTIASEDVSGSISANDYVRLDNLLSDNTEEAYEVKTVAFNSPDTDIVLYFPYEGADKSSVSVIKLPPSPIIDANGGARQVFLTANNYWILDSLQVANSSDTNGHIRVFKSIAYLRNIVIDGTTGTRDGLRLDVSGSNTGAGRCKRIRTINTGGDEGIFCFGGIWELEDIIADTCAHGILATTSIVVVKNVEVSNSTTADLGALFYGRIIARNAILNSATKIATSNILGRIRIEDYNGTLGDDRQFSGLDETDGIASIQRDTSTLRSGGGTSSVKVTPSSKLLVNNSTDNFLTQLIVLDSAFFQEAIAMTYSVFFNLAAAAFTTAPTAVELYVELEYLRLGSGEYREKKISTGVVTADGSWQNIDVTITPGQAGNVYLRVYYAKTLEGGKTNIFNCDTLVDIA